MPKPIANSTGFERDASMYVGSRLDFIQRNSKGSVWKWVPPDLNPADLPTRANSNMEEIPGIDNLEEFVRITTF